ncbi:MAG TPA: adenylate/guanylate cyclase domain-containing protein [Kiloniellaceae bacterium]|nr:adenylate/guanylate cyclase domain-containing protein [Kiloniellaceae bacterium]
MSYPIPDNEVERLASVETYHVTDTPPEVSYDDISELAAEICRCPVGLINIIADTQEWLKAKYGLPPNLTYLPRGTACSTAICQSDLLTVPDLAVDERFADHAAVKGEPHFRFYCGMPLINPEGYALGTVCVFDFEPRDLTFEQSESLRRLSRQTMAQLELRRKLIELSSARQALEAEKEKSDALLLNILPATIADELKTRNEVEPRHYDSVTILFADFKGFTRFAEAAEPRTLVNDLDQYFSAFDEIIERHRLEKLKTIGDAYMCAGGLPVENRTHPADACQAALELQDFMARTNKQREKMRMHPWELRIGLHSGPVMAGVVGKKKFTYDIWGDAVNVAARMESSGEAGHIALSESTYHRVKDRFDCTYRGKIEAKNKGILDAYFLNGMR